MKRTLCILSLALIPIHTMLAQMDSSLYNSFSFGISAGEFGDDSGVGIEIGTPSICQNRILFRVSCNHVWIEDYRAVHNHWASYNAFNASVVYNLTLHENIRPYLEFGATLIVPQTKITDIGNVEGFSCLIGVELFLSSKPKSNVCYYFSLGARHLDAYTNKLETNPRHADGLVLVFSNGFRFYL